MNRFLKKIARYLLFIALFHLIAIFFLGGKTDGIYKRISSPRQKSLVIGSSRAAQGIVPSQINRDLINQGYAELYNFSFSIGHSPYGPVYLKAIKQKLDTLNSNNKRIFILEVNPWILNGTKANPNDTARFRELNRELNFISHFNTNPNLEYLFKCYKRGWGTIILNCFINPAEIKEDGWLKVDFDYSEENLNERLKEKIVEYKRKQGKTVLSRARFEYLEKTIKYLKGFGSVYLVRLPINERISIIEKQEFPGFDSQIILISNKYKVDYLNLSFSNKNYMYTDGNHLHKTSAKKLTEYLIGQIIMTND